MIRLMCGGVCVCVCLCACLSVFNKRINACLVITVLPSVESRVFLDSARTITPVGFNLLGSCTGLQHQ